MKKAITLRLCIVIAVGMFATAFLSYYIQVKSAKESFRTNSTIRINQIIEVLDKNDAEMKKLQAELEQDYFIRAKASSYIIQNQPEVVKNIAELKKIADLLQIDELNIFDTEGKIYSGSEPKYYGYTFNSGEQMQFFLPMLEDRSLQMCQAVTPNTAENKLMQYIAVWREDYKDIIQIGMKPIRLLEAMKKNELSYIFSMMTPEKGTTIFAINPETRMILGSTNNHLMGKIIEDIGIENKSIEESNEGIDTIIDGKKNYSLLQKKGDILVCVSTTYSNLYSNIPKNMILVVLSLCALAMVVMILITRLLDRMIINGIHEVINGMEKISKGDLDARVEVHSTPEFVELSNNINTLVLSLLETTNKLSLVFENVNIPIAAYEYNKDMTRVRATSKIGEILMLEEKETKKILDDYKIFARTISNICEHPYGREKNVYSIGEEVKRYIKIKSYQKESSIWGIIVDVTEETLEKQQIKLERDIDHLTGLLSRRAFFEEIDEIFENKEMLKVSTILMMDLDGLKYVNDSLGHEYGDNLLSKAAEIIKGCKAPNKLISRLGGDEFVLFVYGEKSQEDIQTYLDDLYKNIQEGKLEIPNNNYIQIAMSGGYIFYPEYSIDYKEMMRLADKTMYNVKKGTKGYFEKYQSK